MCLSVRIGFREVTNFTELPVTSESPGLKGIFFYFTCFLAGSKHNPAYLRKASSPETLVDEGEQCAFFGVIIVYRKLPYRFRFSSNEDENV